MLRHAPCRKANRDAAGKVDGDPDKIQEALVAKKVMVTTDEDGNVFYCSLCGRGSIDAIFKALGLESLDQKESIADLKYKLLPKDVVSEPKPLKPKEKMPIDIADVKPAIPAFDFMPKHS